MNSIENNYCFSKKSAFLILAGILLIKFLFNVYGINWGLPDRWNIDEQVAAVLRMIAEKAYYSTVDLWHPTFYKLTLAIFIAPYLAYLKLSGYPLETVGDAASVSWIKLAQVAPDFAANIFIVGRLYSALLGVVAVYLVYLAAKLISGKEVGIYAAFIMALSTGFISVNHFAKSTSLSLVLNVLVLYLSIAAVKKNKFVKHIIFASFVAGLATATKYDAGISVIYIIAAYFMHIVKTDMRERNLILRYLRPGIIAGCLTVFMFGVFVGWPAYFIKHDMFVKNGMENPVAVIQGGITIYGPAIKFFTGLGKLVADFNLLLSTFIFGGFIYLCVKFKKFPKEILIPVAMLPVYFFYTSVFLFPQTHSCMTKLIVQSFPVLAIVGGFAVFFFLKNKQVGTAPKIAIIILVLAYSLVYDARAVTVFSNKDTRYSSTQWILKNIPEGATVEHLQDSQWLFAPSTIVDKYQMVYYGRNSMKYAKSLYFNSNLDYDGYIESLNKAGCNSEYFIAGMGKELEHPPLMMDGDSEKSFFGKLLAGEVNFELIKKFEFKESVFWNYRPGYSSPTIYIFKNNKLLFPLIKDDGHTL